MRFFRVNDLGSRYNQVYKILLSHVGRINSILFSFSYKIMQGGNDSKNIITIFVNYLSTTISRALSPLILHIEYNTT